MTGHKPVTTWVGKVKYARKPKKWNGLAMTRIVVEVNNNGLASDVNWLATARIAWHNTKHIWKAPARLVQEGQYDEIISRLLNVGDWIVAYLVPLLEKTPAVGGFVSAAAGIYTSVRDALYGGGTSGDFGQVDELGGQNDDMSAGSEVEESPKP